MMHLCAICCCCYKQNGKSCYPCAQTVNQPPLFNQIRAEIIFTCITSFLQHCLFFVPPNILYSSFMHLVDRIVTRTIELYPIHKIPKSIEKMIKYIALLLAQFQKQLQNRQYSNGFSTIKLCLHKLHTPYCPDVKFLWNTLIKTSFTYITFLID